MIRCRNYKNYNSKQICEELNQKNFDGVYCSSEPRKAWEILKHILKETMLTPFIMKRIKGSNKVPADRNIKEQMNDRDRLIRPGNIGGRYHPRGEKFSYGFLRWYTIGIYETKS